MSAQQPTQVVTTQPTTVVAGGCPTCGVGRVDDSFTTVGIILAILFFPLGILCCLLMKEKKCDRCGARF
ncbi:hypothetical protein ACF0H5_001611 [Mactra antiquata]